MMSLLLLTQIKPCGVQNFASQKLKGNRIFSQTINDDICQIQAEKMKRFSFEIILFYLNYFKCGYGH